MAVTAHGDALQKLYASSAAVVKQLQAFAETFKTFTSPDIESAPEKVKALSKVKELLPKYVATVLYELNGG